MMSVCLLLCCYYYCGAYTKVKETKEIDMKVGYI